MNYLEELVMIPRWSVFLVIALGFFIGFLIGICLNAPKDWDDL